MRVQMPLNLQKETGYLIRAQTPKPIYKKTSNAKIYTNNASVSTNGPNTAIQAFKAALCGAGELVVVYSI